MLIRKPPQRDEHVGSTYHSGGAPSPLQEFSKALRRFENDQQLRFQYDLDGGFVVALKAAEFRPSHEITLRNQVDGWKADIQGVFWDGYWLFRLDPDGYPEGVQARFYVDGLSMRSGAISLRPETDIAQIYFETKFQFPTVPSSYLHAYDNLQVSRTRIQQELVQENHDPSVTYDVIIIGSGMGGGILADALSDNDVNTLLLEAGSLNFPTHIDNLPGYTFNFDAAQAHEVGSYVNRPGSVSAMANGIQMNLGGRSVYWEGLIPRMDDWELAYWPKVIRDYLSPIGYTEAEKLLRKRKTLGPFQDTLVAALAAELVDHRVGDLPRALHQPNLDPATMSLQNVLHRSTGVFSTTDLLLDSLSTDPYVGRDFLTVNLNHLVTKIETYGSSATEVVCRDLLGNVERRYKGRFVVLAAGSLESPRIALASALSDPSGKIGVGLTDHPAFVHRQPVELDAASPYAGESHHAKILIRHTAGAAHPYFAELVINPRYWDTRHSDDDVMDIATRSTPKTFASMKFLFDSELNDSNEIKYLGSGSKLEVFVEPNDSALPFKSEVMDLRNKVFSFLQCNFDPTEEMIYYRNGSVHHAGGSLRMSDDHSGVVDENLKFEAYDNLYCCDVSVFPRIPTANPCLTLAALTQRLARHLKSLV